MRNRGLSIVFVVAAIVTAASIAEAAGDPHIVQPPSSGIRLRTPDVLNNPTVCSGTDGATYATIISSVRGRWIGGNFDGYTVRADLVQTYRTDIDFGWATGSVTVRDPATRDVVLVGTFTLVTSPNGAAFHDARGWLDGVLYAGGEPTSDHLLANIEGRLTFRDSDQAGGILGFGTEPAAATTAIVSNEETCGSGDPHIEQAPASEIRLGSRDLLNSPTSCTGADGNQYASIAAPDVRGTWLSGLFQKRPTVASEIQTFDSSTNYGWQHGEIEVRSQATGATLFAGSYDFVVGPQDEADHAARGWLAGVVYQAGQPTTRHLLANVEGQVTYSSTSFTGGDLFLGIAPPVVGDLAVVTNLSSCT